MTALFPSKVYNLPFVPGSDHLYFRIDFPKKTSFEQIDNYWNFLLTKLPFIDPDFKSRISAQVLKFSMLVIVHGKGIRDLYFSKKAEKLRKRVEVIFSNAIISKKNEFEFDDQIFLILIKIKNLGCCSCSQSRKEA